MKSQVYRFLSFWTILLSCSSCGCCCFGKKYTNCPILCFTSDWLSMQMNWSHKALTLDHWWVTLTSCVWLEAFIFLVQRERCEGQGWWEVYRLQRFENAFAGMTLNLCTSGTSLDNRSTVILKLTQQLPHPAFIVCASCSQKTLNGKFYKNKHPTF